MLARDGVCIVILPLTRVKAFGFGGSKLSRQKSRLVGRPVSLGNNQQGPNTNDLGASGLTFRL